MIVVLQARRSRRASRCRPRPRHAGDGLLARYPELAGVGDPDRPGIVHRLDRDTSGLMVVARSEPAYDALVRPSPVREINARYDALVWGDPENPRGVVDAPIGRSTSGGPAWRSATRARRARTVYEVRSGRRGPRWRGCCLPPGDRPRALRSASTSGDPGTRWWGRRLRRPAGGIDLDRPFLHAEWSRSRTPVTGEPARVRWALPPDSAGASNASGLRVRTTTFTRTLALAWAALGPTLRRVRAAPGSGAPVGGSRRRRRPPCPLRRRRPPAYRPRSRGSGEHLRARVLRGRSLGCSRRSQARSVRLMASLARRVGRRAPSLRTA